MKTEKNKHLLRHPIFTDASSIREICQPLHYLNITYFCHVSVDKNNHFTAINNNPSFSEYYFTNKHYNNDIHPQNNSFKKYVIWDNLSLSGKSQELNSVGSEKGINHTFTIINNHHEKTDYYHFSTNLQNKSFNQVYLSNLDLLEKFISYFNEIIKQATEISLAYNFKFIIDENCSGLKLEDDLNFYVNQENLLTLIHSTESDHSNKLSQPQKSSEKIIELPPQQEKCVTLLMQGLSVKQIAYRLALSTRTVESYLINVRKKLGCRNSKELILNYLKYKPQA